jgi:hypothetical protein
VSLFKETKMRYVVLFEHKTYGQRGVVDVFDTEADAITAATKNAVRAEFIFYVCPMQTKITGDVMVSTTVMAPTVTTVAASGTAAPATVDPAPAPLNVSPTL